MISNDEDLRLAEIDGQTPEEFLGQTQFDKLPLTDDERDQMEHAIRKKEALRIRISLGELMSFVFAFCLLLGLARWMPFEIYTVALGCATAILLLFNSFLTPRYRGIAIGVLLTAYLLSAIWLVYAG